MKPSVLIAWLVALFGWTLLSAQPVSAQGLWIRAESKDFVIYTDAEPAMAQRFADRLQAFDSILRLYHGQELEKPVRRKLPIYLLRRETDMRRIQPGVPSSLRGFYTSSLDDTYAVAIAEDEDSPTLQHEYVHHFMLAGFPGGMPGWLIEGYAEYFMTFRNTRQGPEVGRPNANRTTWLLRGSWVPYATVLKVRSGELRTGQDQQMYYAQSWALTHWFFTDPARRRQLSAYIANVNRGQDSISAMKTATGMSPEQLDRAIKSYLAGRFSFERPLVTLPPAAPVQITPLPVSAPDVLLLSLRVKRDNGIDAPEDKTDGPVLLNDVRRAAARHPGDPLAELTLARAEIKLGDLAQAERLLGTRLAADPNSIEALQLMAFARLKAAETAEGDAARRLRSEAGEFAGRAFRLGPNHYQTLIAYAQSREGGRGWPTPNDIEVLQDALDLAPQVGVLRLKTARALAERGRRVEAAQILRPLAYNPHGGKEAEAARSLIAALEKPVGAPPVAAPSVTSR